MKKVYLFSVCCILLACGVFIGRAILLNKARSGSDVPADITEPGSESQLVENADVAEYTAEKITLAETAAPPPQSETLGHISQDPVSQQTGENLVDFAALQQLSGDIYAWITIDGTSVDYPILQHPADDDYYLTHAFDGSGYAGGSVFTQGTYNTRSFDDPVTVVYGQTTESGVMFGPLQTVYSEATGFAEHSDIRIYLPGEVRHYTVFAAVPYDDRNILENYDFTEKYWYKNFFASIKQIRSIGSNINRDITPEYGDRVMILSTFLRGDSTKRFLVMAVLNDDI